MKINTFSEAPFQGVKETQRRTGLPKGALYKGAKDGTYPCIRQGSRILFNVPLLLDILNQQSTGGGDAG